jgi:hypothetical protein
MDQHTQNFFGQKTGLMISTDAKENPYLFIRCIKKKANGDWEKYSESKNVKLSLLEIVSINDVLNKKRKLWSTFHSYNEIKTPISFTWDDHDPDLLWINIDEYSRPLNYPETELLRLLIIHILDEKIIFATVRKEIQDSEKSFANDNGELKSNVTSEVSQKNVGVKLKTFEQNQPKIEKIEKIKSKNLKNKDEEEETTNLQGKIKMNRDKAILITLDNNDELWLPKSTIMNSFKNDETIIQKFQVKKWILEKRTLAST